VDTNQISVLHPLLDLIIIEGVYPSLSPGVGFPAERQKRSLLCDREAKSFPDLGCLDVIILETLNPICFSETDGLGVQIRDRLLVDLVAANADLSFSPVRDQMNKSTAKIELYKIINRYDMS
jgi:hypothetical protein